MSTYLYVFLCVLASFFTVGSINVVLASSDSIWLTVKDRDLRVQKGSALDFEPLFNTPQNSSAGTWDKRYLCAPLVFTATHGYMPSKEELVQVVTELKRRGYNLVRFHFLDNTLMKGAKKDFDFNQEQADRVFYFLYLLKKNNIDYMIDAATSWNGAYGNVGKNRYTKKYNLKLNVHFSQEAQAHWKKMVKTILGSINPYTKSPILLEPNLIAITTFNELGLAFNTRLEGKFPPVIKYKFQQWLRKRGEVGIETPNLKDTTEASSLMNAFLLESERKTFSWMERYIRSLGYAGSITSYNNGKTIHAMGARQDIDLISVHAYHDNPNKFVRKGSWIRNTSSIAQRVPYIQYMSMVREVGKPFIVDEYNQPYWNEWRREAGIAMSAYGSFQGWQAICRYENPIVLGYRQKAPRRERAIYPYSVGMDPVARAGEVLSALLFRRSDVKQGRRITGVLFQNSDFTSNRALKLPVPFSFTQLSLLTPLGALYNNSDSYDVDVVIPFVTSTRFKEFRAFNQKLWRTNVEKLADSSLLYSNKSRANELISSTGEIFLNSSEKKLTVITSKTEAIVYDKLNSIERLESLTILKASGESALSISSLDDKDLKFSTRMLIIFATDARNSRSQLNSSGTRLLKLGRLPVQIKAQNVVFSLETDKALKMRLYALNLRGERVERLPVQKKGNGIIITINLLKLKNGPTTFFELAAE